MRNLTTQLTQYAEYHRDPRNILTHFIGVPMIVLAVVILLSRPVLLSLVQGELPITPAVLVVLAVCVFYGLLDLRYCVAMALVLAVMLAIGQWCAQQSTGFWIAAGVGLFVVGWVIQFVGHYYEGRKPAFVDDVSGLIVGPLFVVAEWAFALGLRKEVQSAIELRSGPVRLRTRQAAT